MWSSSAAVIPQSKFNEMWSSAAPFLHDLWYFRQWTNEHFSSVLFIRKNVTSEPHKHFTEGLMIPLRRVKLRGEWTSKHNHCAPEFTTKMWSWVVLKYHHKLRRLASNGFRYFIVNFSNCLQVEFPTLNKINDYALSNIYCAPVKQKVHSGQCLLK